MRNADTALVYYYLRDMGYGQIKIENLLRLSLGESNELEGVYVQRQQEESR